MPHCRVFTTSFSVRVGWTVYVNRIKGSNHISCGTSRLPCKDLTTGVKQVHSFGTVLVIGEQYIQETVNITKHVFIRNVHMGNAIVVSNGSTPFAFKTLSTIIFNLSSIRFQNIGIVSVSDLSAININNYNGAGFVNIYRSTFHCVY